MNKKDQIKQIKASVGFPSTLADIFLSANNRNVLMIGPISEIIKQSSDSEELKNKQIISYAFDSLEISGLRKKETIAKARVQLDANTNLLTDINIQKLATMVGVRSN